MGKLLHLVTVITVVLLILYSLTFEHFIVHVWHISLGNISSNFRDCMSVNICDVFRPIDVSFLPFDLRKWYYGLTELW